MPIQPTGKAPSVVPAHDLRRVSQQLQAMAKRLAELERRIQQPTYAQKIPTSTS